MDRAGSERIDHNVWNRRSSRERVTANSFGKFRGECYAYLGVGTATLNFNGSSLTGRRFVGGNSAAEVSGSLWNH